MEICSALPRAHDAARHFSDDPDCTASVRVATHNGHRVDRIRGQ